VVGYDGRTNSAVFATDVARILSREGISVWLLPRALPTPVLAFSVRHLRAAYGLMITASHNPRRDNGLKLYVRDGAQLLPPVDADMATFIDAVDPLKLPQGWSEGDFTHRSAGASADAYVEAVAAGGTPPTVRRASPWCTPRFTAWERSRSEPCSHERDGRCRCL